MHFIRDVIVARNGKSTEITNTDAEGRLILADALVRATELAPKMVLDYATLTGAARVALGIDLPAVFSNDQDKLLDIWKLSASVDDPMWLMPLHKKYKKMLKSNIADMVNAVEGGMGGAITAALYLSEFLASKKHLTDSDDEEDCDYTDNSITNSESHLSAGKTPLWVHIDFMGSKGGMAEPQGLLTMYEYIKQEYSNV